MYVDVTMACSELLLHSEEMDGEGMEKIVAAESAAVQQAQRV